MRSIHLRQVRATPHHNTNMSPAKLLFIHSYRNKLPDMRPMPAEGREDIAKAVAKDQENKARMRRYKDFKGYVKPDRVKVGGKVLLERKTTKRNSPYDPNPFEVVEVVGTRVKAKMGKTTKTRDSQKWKVSKPDKQVSVKVPIAERNTRWELKIEPHRAQLAPQPSP